MTIETALYPNQLNATLPPQSDIVREGAGHLRLLKTVVKTTFPNLGGAWNATQTEANYIVGVTSPIQAQINSKGAIAGQTWTGAHVFSGTAAVPTLAQGTSTTGAASTAFVQAEWATRLPNYTAPITANSTELNRLVGVTSAVQSQINAKGAIAGQTWTGTHSFPNTTTVGPLTPTIQGYLSTATSDVQAQINSKAAKAGDTYTGAHNYTGATVTVQTLAPGSSGAAAASVDYANALAFASSLPAQTGNAGKFITTNGATASWSDTINGNLNFTGNARRITGDFSNATIANRLAFQTSVANGLTSLTAIPNGTGNTSQVALYSAEDVNNALLFDLRSTNTDARIRALGLGSAANVPLLFDVGGSERLRIDPTTGNVLATSGALGYGVGAGGTVVQATSKSTGVTLNKPSGRITTNNAALAAGASVIFILTNATIAITDEVSVTMLSGANYRVDVIDIFNGGCTFRVTNISASSLSDALAFNFKVFKVSLS